MQRFGAREPPLLSELQRRFTQIVRLVDAANSSHGGLRFLKRDAAEQVRKEEVVPGGFPGRIGVRANAVGLRS
jgi:hypothetical protein